MRAPPLLRLDPELAKAQIDRDRTAIRMATWRPIQLVDRNPSGCRFSITSLLKTLISGLNITSYQGLLKTALDETERKTTQTLLREEEIWLKQHTLKGDPKARPSTGR